MFQASVTTQEPEWAWSEKNQQQSKHALAEQVLSLVLAKINVLSEDSQQKLNPVHFDRILNYIQLNQTIEMVLPAFPAKSSNPEKTMGNLPDMGEVLALKFLQTLCEKIKSIYAP